MHPAPTTRAVSASKTQEHRKALAKRVLSIFFITVVFHPEPNVNRLLPHPKGESAAIFLADYRFVLTVRDTLTIVPGMLINDIDAIYGSACDKRGWEKQQ